MLKKPLLLLGYLLCLLCSCDSSSWSQKSTVSPPTPGTGILHVAHPPGLHTLDPRKTNSRAEQSLALWLFEGLTRLNEQGKAELSLANKVDISDDLRTYIFRLRRSYWSSGRPLTAFDFEYAWRQVLTPRFQAPHAESLFVIRHARLVKEGKEAIHVAGIRAMDDYTLVVELEEPTPHFLELVANPVFFPIESQVDRTHPHWALSADQNFSCNGPFSLESWEHGSLVKLKKNMLYWDLNKVQLGNIQSREMPNEDAIEAFRSGSLDWVGTPLQKLSHPSISDSTPLPQSRWGIKVLWCQLNTKRAPLNQKRLRRALGLALKRESLDPGPHQPWAASSSSLISPMQGWQVHPLSTGEDIEQAQELTHEAIQLSPDTLNIKLQMACTVPELLPLAKQLIKHWEKTLSLKIELIPPQSSKVPLAHIVLAKSQNISASPIELLQVFHNKGQDSGWNASVYQQLIEMSKTERRDEQHQRVLSLAEQLLLEEAPVIPLLHERFQYKSHPRSNGALLLPTGCLDLKQAALKTQDYQLVGEAT